MLYNFLTLIFTGLIVLYSPWWWLTLLLLLSVLLVSDNFYLILVPVMALSLLYGIGHGWLRAAIILALVAVPLFNNLKSRLRFV